MKYRIYRKQFYILIGLTFLTFFVLLIFKNVGTFLVIGHSPLHKVKTFVCMGSVPDRALATIDLFKSGKIKHIYLVEENMLGLDTLRKLGFDLESQSQQFISILIQAGIPDSIITLIPGLARSTLEEAFFLSKWLRNKNPRCLDTILIVTSAHHTRRAGIIFKNVLQNTFNHQINVLTYPSAYTGFDAKYWYKHKESIQVTLSEYFKLLSFFFIERKNRLI